MDAFLGQMLGYVFLIAMLAIPFLATRPIRSKVLRYLTLLLVGFVLASAIVAYTREPAFYGAFVGLIIIGWRVIWGKESGKGSDDGDVPSGSRRKRHDDDENSTGDIGGDAF